MGKMSAEEVKKDIDAQKKAVADLKKATKDARKDGKLRSERRVLRRLQRRWRQMTGKKLATSKKAAGGTEEKKA
jgi:hypothetical protein